MVRHPPPTAPSMGPVLRVPLLGVERAEHAPPLWVAGSRSATTPLPMRGVRGGRAMSRAWLAVYAAMTTKPKYRRLSAISKGGLLHVFLLAAFQDPEATWDDPDELREALSLEGFPAGVYDELAASQWIEPLEG